MLSTDNLLLVVIKQAIIIINKQLKRKILKWPLLKVVNIKMDQTHFGVVFLLEDTQQAKPPTPTPPLYRRQYQQLK